jgi:hypothetical protein
MLTGSVGHFTAIDINLANSPVSNIQGNTINNINWSISSASGTPGAAEFNGVIVNAGGVNIGTTSGNTIGATTGTGSASNGIYISSTSSGAEILPFYINSVGCTLQNNNIGAIATNGAASIGFYFFGIYLTGSGSNNVIANNIGNPTANSISIGTNATTTATCYVYAIYNNASGIETIGTSGNGNTIQNLTNYSTSSSSYMTALYNNNACTLLFNYNTIAYLTFSPTSGTYYCVYNTSAIKGTSSISNNSFDYITFTGSAFSGYVYLIYNTAAATDATF